MNSNHLTIIKSQIKESRRCIDRANWYLKKPARCNLPDGLRTLAAIEALKAIYELSQATAVLLDPEQAVLLAIKNRCESSSLCVNKQSEINGICHISEPAFGVLKNVKNRMEQRKKH